MPEVGTDFVIERAHRVGRTRSHSKLRKIVARFLNYKDREAIFKARKKLHETNTLFFLNKNVFFFPAQAEYSYSSADFRLKIF